MLWHGDASVSGVDAVVVPGGFAHGDYLRPGAIARFSPVMQAVAAFAGQRRPGRRHLQRLPGAHRGRPAPGRAAEEPRSQVPLHHGFCACRVDRLGADLAGRPPVTILRIPINHFEGNYTCSAETLAELQAEDRVVLRYVDNPNGSIDDIAGICSQGRNVVGPHAPPRAGQPGAARQHRRRAVAALAAGGIGSGASRHRLSWPPAAPGRGTGATDVDGAPRVRRARRPGVPVAPVPAGAGPVSRLG